MKERVRKTRSLQDVHRCTCLLRIANIINPQELVRKAVSPRENAGFKILANWCGSMGELNGLCRKTPKETEMGGKVSTVNIQLSDYRTSSMVRFETPGT